MPILRSTPARMTEIAVGASTCASGSQVWNGNIGILIAKPMNSADPDDLGERRCRAAVRCLPAKSLA